jgi:hypothetical protein
MALCGASFRMKSCASGSCRTGRSSNRGEAYFKGVEQKSYASRSTTLPLLYIPTLGCFDSEFNKKAVTVQW